MFHPLPRFVPRNILFCQNRMGLAGQVSTHFLDHGRLLGLVRLFHLDGEGNFVAWFHSMLLLAAVLLGSPQPT